MAYDFPATFDVLRTDTFDSWATKTNQLRADVLFIQSIIGNGNLNTSNTNSLIDAINEVKTGIGSGDTANSTIGSLTDLYDIVEGATVVASINKTKDYVDTTTSGFKTEVQINDIINLKQADILTRLGAVESSTGTPDARIGQIVTSVGEAVYQSTAENAIANKNELKADIAALDASIVVLSGAEVDVSWSNSYVAVSGGLISKSTSGNSVTLSHATGGDTSSKSTMAANEVINRVITDSSGHVSSYTYKTIGTMASQNQTVSTSDPSASDGNNGDVWYKI